MNRRTSAWVATHAPADTRWGRKTLALLLSLVLCLALLAVTVFAASDADTLTFDIAEGSVTISNGSEKDTVKISYGENQTLDNVAPNNVITITGESECVNSNGACRTVTVSAKTPVTIRLQDVRIKNRYHWKTSSAFRLEDGADVTLTLFGDNELISSSTYAGIRVPTNSTLTISGDGSLDVRNISTAQGIGGNEGEDMGTVIIKSGTVNAHGGGASNSPGIGTRHNKGEYGYDENNGRIILNGGTVYAEGNDDNPLASGIVSIGNVWHSSEIKLAGDGGVWLTTRGKINADTTGFNGVIDNVVYGNAVVKEDRSIEKLLIPKGTTLTVKSGKTLTIARFGEIEVNGTITVDEGGVLKKISPETYTPELESRTKGSITLKAVPHVQYGYSANGSEPETWQDSPVFSGLSESTEYTFFVRVESETLVYSAGVSRGAAIHTLPHTISSCDEYDSESHTGYCTICEQTVTDEHQYGDGVHVDDPQLPYTSYPCSMCGYEKIVYDSAMEIKMTDDDDDGWQGNYLVIRRDNELWKRIALYDGEEETVYLPYSEASVYAFFYEKGRSSSEVGIKITLPGQSAPVYDKENFSEVADGTLLLHLNAGDYTAVETAVDQIPDLSGYTVESVQAFQKLVDAINWDLPKSRQSEIDAYPDAIRAGIEALVQDTAGETDGVFHLTGKAESLYITETGWRWGKDGKETPYTGAYRIGGVNTNGVVVESGNLDITLFHLSVTNNNVSPFQIQGNAHVQLTLLGSNELICTYKNDSFDYAGLYVGENAVLTITEQSTGSLLARSRDDAAGIGGNYDDNNQNEKSGEIIINGGTVTAISGGSGAGIGSGAYYGTSGSITINGGNIKAISRKGGAGIGSGYNASCGSVTITGGTIVAESYDDGAGIGSGDAYDENRSCDSILISDGDITAISWDGGAGIGSGKYGACGTITISGGSITADGYCDGVGVGAGESGTSGAITISGGVIKATGYGTGSGIGSGENGTSGAITISGGSIIAQNSAGASTYGDAGAALSAEPDLSGYTAYRWRSSAAEPYCADKFIWSADDTYVEIVSGYSVIFDPNGGALAPGEETALTNGDGKLASLPIPTRSGSYRFDGWYTEKTGGDAITTDYKFSADTTVYAHWTYTGGSSGSYTPSYAVTVEKSANGAVSADRKTASSGTTVTITVTPDKGYTLETITVLDKDGKEVKITETNGKYTFTMPASSVTVKATFMDDNTMLNFFVDVKASDYYYDAVLWAAQNGITSGTDAVHFSPSLPCTRAQIVTFLWRAAGSPVVNYAMNMTDVPEDAYYAEAVRWALSEGITAGTTATTFSPDETCTRAQAVVFLFRYAAPEAVTLQELVSGFSDAASVPGYALSAMNWALADGIVKGDGSKLLPNDSCTRAQIVTFLYRALEK